MRSVYRLLGLVRRYGAGPVDTACGTAPWTSTSSPWPRSPRCCERATENTHPPLPAAAGRPPARFARDPGPSTPPRARTLHARARPPRRHRPGAEPMTTSRNHRHRRPGPPTRSAPTSIGLLRTLKLGRPDDTLARTARPGPPTAPVATPRSWNSCSPTRSPAATPRSATAPRPRRRPGPGHAAGHLGRRRRPPLRPAPAGRPDHPAVPRRPATAP